MTDKWNAFPHPRDAYDYAGDALEANWTALHLGDKEPYPSQTQIEQLCTTYPKLNQSLPYEDTAKIAETLQEAWRCYHRGDYQQAYDTGLSLGKIGHLVACRAQAMYAYYLEAEASNEQRDFSKSAADRAEALCLTMPDYANAHFIYAYALGRYSQSISVVKALTQGLGGKIKASSEKAIRLAPDHAEAHLALGAYHAEVIDKVGSIVAGVTYGAKKDIGIEHYEKALTLTSETPATYIEYASGLLMLFGKKKLKEATEAYKKAATLSPLDATQCLDVELAKAELAD